MNEVRVVNEQPTDPEKLRLGGITEHDETHMLEAASEHLGQINGLRPEVWSGMNENDREWCLRQVGGKLSEVYECPPPPFIGSQMAKVEGGVLLGEHSDANYITRLNSDLLRESDASEALKTYCHEFRHAYQHEMVERYESSFRHLCHDEAAAAQWAENFREGRYISFEGDPEGYEAQPVEADARAFADTITERVRTKLSN